MKVPRRLPCWLGLHKWTMVSCEYRQSKAGVLFGFMQVEQEVCRCGAGRQVLEVSSLFGKPTRKPIQHWPDGILNNWLPPDELQQWQVDRGEERIAEALEAPHTCGTLLTRKVHRHDMFQATGQPKDQIGAWCESCRRYEVHYSTHY